MALFAAYAEQSGAETPGDEETHSWLNNSSFKVDTETLNKASSSKQRTSKQKIDDTVGDRLPKKPKFTKNIVASVNEAHTSSEKTECFAIDVTRNKEFLSASVSTISRPSAPKYRVRYRIDCSRKRKMKKIQRYFSVTKNADCDRSNSEDEEIITKENIDKIENSKPDEHFTGFRQEEDLSKTTAYFSRNLGENPNDIGMWLRYVQFQDTVYQFEKTYRKGSIAKGLRITAERKLAILDKALNHNPNCEELLRERLHIAVNVYPSDELKEQLKSLVDKDPSNIILWQGYIEATQCSMSHCSADSVLSLYKKCLATLNKLGRFLALERSLLEDSILRMLYQCGLFLKQAGLFEQLWTLLRLYLELNLSPLDSEKFNLDSSFQEKQLTELEDVIFNSQLPLHELWLRTEKLRESCHWLPYRGDSDCEDPQRIVFHEDVAELIHPITMPENIFKLIAFTFTLLKIPLLPCRHVTMGDLGLDYVPWSIDSIESLLPAFFTLYHIESLNQNLLNDNKLAVGPQYLKVLPGQEEYLQFILKIMQNLCDCFYVNSKLAAIVWWFRFQRLLLILDKSGRFNLNDQFKKKIKTNVKNILKEDTFKHNLLLYCEYAHIEKELNGVENGINILTRILSVSHDTTLSANPTPNQVNVCHTYRNLVELMLSPSNCTETDKLKALKHIVNYVTGKKFSNSLVLTQGSLNEASLIFKHITLQMLNCDIPVINPADQFLPNFFLDWIICNGWFIYLHKGLIESGVFLENTLSALDEKLPGKLFQKEVLYEFYIAILFKHSMQNSGSGTFKILDDVLHRAIEMYPNNLFILSILAKEQSIVSGLSKDWWKVKNILLKTNRTFPVIFLVLISNDKISKYIDNLQDTITGNKYEIDGNFKNKMLSLFRRITRSDISTRRCGLIWRLYLQFVYEHFNPSVVRNVYYRAVEECPWLKALYIDAAIYIPAELPQIQDLIIEKQLRIHITPEELDILRT